MLAFSLELQNYPRGPPRLEGTDEDWTKWMVFIPFYSQFNSCSIGKMEVSLKACLWFLLLIVCIEYKLYRELVSFEHNISISWYLSPNVRFLSKNIVEKIFVWEDILRVFVYHQVVYYQTKRKKIRDIFPDQFWLALKDIYKKQSKVA